MLLDGSKIYTFARSCYYVKLFVSPTSDFALEFQSFHTFSCDILVAIDGVLGDAPVTRRGRAPSGDQLYVHVY